MHKTLYIFWGIFVTKWFNKIFIILFFKNYGFYSLSSPFLSSKSGVSSFTLSFFAFSKSFFVSSWIFLATGGTSWTLSLLIFWALSIYLSLIFNLFAIYLISSKSYSVYAIFPSFNSTVFSSIYFPSLFKRYLLCVVFPFSEVLIEITSGFLSLSFLSS